MVWLGERSEGRDNNLNLIRILAAVAVLVSHAWPIALGPGTVEPLQAFAGVSLGTMAVFVFFAISGYLISASYERSRSVAQFVRARVMRLAPGLIVSLVLVALVMGPMVTTLPLADYLAHRETWSFLLNNIGLVIPHYALPGVYETNSYPTVEGIDLDLGP